MKVKLFNKYSGQKLIDVLNGIEFSEQPGSGKVWRPETFEEERVWQPGGQILGGDFKHDGTLQQSVRSMGVRFFHVVFKNKSLLRDEEGWEEDLDHCFIVEPLDLDGGYVEINIKLVSRFGNQELDFLNYELRVPKEYHLALESILKLFFQRLYESEPEK